MQLTIIILFNLLLSFTVTNFLVPIVNKLGSIYSLLDQPNKRKQKEKPIVRIGGVSMILGFIFTSFSNYILTSVIFQQFFFNSYLLIFLIGSFLFFLIGLLDDLFTISPLKRLISQILIALWVIHQGIKIDNIFLDLSWLGMNNLNLELNLFFSYTLSLLWIVGLVNAFNWLDGLDGLAAGASIILAITLTVITIINSNYELAIFGIILIGICTAFLFYNRYPSKIIMGDGGSNLLGFLFSAITLIATTNDIQFTNLVYATLILIIPIGDMFFVILNRIRKGHSPFYPDRNHLHFRLINIGFKHKQSVNQMYIFFIFTSLISIYFQTSIFNKSLLIIFTLPMILNFYINRKRYRLVFDLRKN